MQVSNTSSCRRSIPPMKKPSDCWQSKWYQPSSNKTSAHALVVLQVVNLPLRDPAASLEVKGYVFWEKRTSREREDEIPFHEIRKRSNPSSPDQRAKKQSNRQRKTQDSLLWLKPDGGDPQHHHPVPFWNHGGAREEREKQTRDAREGAPVLLPKRLGVRRITLCYSPSRLDTRRLFVWEERVRIRKGRATTGGNSQNVSTGRAPSPGILGALSTRKPIHRTT